MTKIYLTRHGETVWNRQCRFQGHKNSDLTEKGILAAELLADRIEEIELDYIVSSPLMRAYNTAEIIRGNKNIQIIKHDGLKEINLGKFEGMSYKDIQKNYSKLLAEIEKDPFNNRYPNGENLQEFYKRVVKAFNEVIDKYRNKSTLIVAHGGTIKCIEAYTGLGLLPLVTAFDAEKTVRRTTAAFGDLTGAWQALSGVTTAGYEIHHGQTAQHPAMAAKGDIAREVMPGLAWQNLKGNVLGCYLHGLFEDPAVLRALFGATVPTLETVFDGLADFLEQHVEPGVLDALIHKD